MLRCVHGTITLLVCDVCVSPSTGGGLSVLVEAFHADSDELDVSDSLWN